MKTERNILGDSQIKAMYKNLPSQEKLDVLERAFATKEAHPTKSKTDCVALIMGYELSQSGSGFYIKKQVKITPTSITI